MTTACSQGIITDGDLRRHMGDGLLSRRTGEIMTAAPKTASPELLGERRARDDQFLGASPRCSWSRTGRPVGIIHIHDLLRAGVA